MKSIEVRIEDLKFDLQNPRFENSSDQREILKKIINNQKDKLCILARDIVNQGLNPIDRLILIDDDNHKGHFIVLEGNRRLAVLKLISNTALLNSLDISASRKRKMLKYAQQFDSTVIEPIDAVLFDNREEANHWIELRHTGENGGAGIVSWDGIATARFNGNNVSLQLIEFARKFGNLDKNVIKGLETFNITNLDRLLGDPYVRGVLGIDIQSRKIGTSLPQNEVIKGLRKIISDISTEDINVSHIRYKKDRKKYIDNLSAAAKPNLSRATDFWTLDAPGVASTSVPMKRRPQAPATRKTLIPKECKLPILDQRISSIFKELRKMKTEDTPNAIAVLFRVFLELTVDHYIEANKLPDVNNYSSLPKKIQATEKVLIAKGINSESLKPIRVATSDKDSFLACDTFHAYVHSRSMSPIPTELQIAWDRAQSFFEAIWS